MSNILNRFFNYNKENNEVEISPINIPTSWDEMNLNTYQKLQKYYKTLNENDKIDLIKLLSILTDKDEDDIRLLPTKFLNILLDKTLFLNEKPEIKETNKIVIDNETYYINTMETMAMGEWVDANTAMDNDGDDYATILAILCRKEGEKYDNDFINNKFEERVRIFKNLSVTNSLNLISFFLRFLDVFLMNSPNSIQGLRQEIEALANSIVTSLNSGDYKGFCSYWQKRKLKKYQKYLSQI